MPKNMDLFRAALGNQSYINDIISCPENHLQFIKQLKDNQFDYQEIIELIDTVSNPQIKSLLIIRLLSQKEYLSLLEGESLLERLAFTGSQAIPSRLNAWVYQIDSSQLTQELIRKMEPEAAVSILCSIPHFHQLTNKQVDDLLHQYLKEELVIYWIKNYASMPNAYPILAHLMNIISTNVLEAIKNLHAAKKEAVLISILEHLNLFDPVPKQLLDLANQESHLILAMKLYSNGHYYQAYIDFIKQSITRLLNSRHQFSPEALHLLFCIYQAPELQSLLNKTVELIKDYLRINAKEGAIALFYKNGILNLEKISATIPIKKCFYKKSQSQNQPIDETPKTEENVLVQELIEKNRSINCIEYFLIHYQAEIKPLNILLNAYMNYYAQEQKSKIRERAIYPLGLLLLKDPLNPHVKEALFTAFLEHTKLHDEVTVHCLFLYNATKTIQYFGLQGGDKNYKMVLELCSVALKKLNMNKHKEIIQIIQKAQEEANIELQFTKEKGWFSTLINHIKRCWIYGWTGFFIPNTPIYVVEKSKLPTQKTTNIEEVLLEKIPSLKEKDPETLLKEMGAAPLAREKAKLLIKALEEYTVPYPIIKEVINELNCTLPHEKEKKHKIRSKPSANPAQLIQSGPALAQITEYLAGTMAEANNTLHWAMKAGSTLFSVPQCVGTTGHKVLNGVKGFI